MLESTEEKLDNENQEKSEPIKEEIKEKSNY